MIDENLIRRTLSAAQRAKLIKERKAVYEAMHPETKHGATGKVALRAPKLGTLKTDRFTKDTAAKTGKSETAVKRDATRAKALGDDLDRVAGTSLDKGSELDALAKMSPEERAPLIERAASGESVSALHSGDEVEAQADGAFPVIFGSCHGGRVISERSNTARPHVVTPEVKPAPAPLPSDAVIAALTKELAAAKAARLKRARRLTGCAPRSSNSAIRRRSKSRSARSNTSTKCAPASSKTSTSRGWPSKLRTARARHRSATTLRAK